MKEYDLAISLGIKYTDFYDLPRPKPSELISKGSLHGFDLYQIGEMDGELFAQLLFAVNMSEPKQVIEEIMIGKEPIYRILGLYSKVNGKVEYNPQKKTHIWNLKNDVGEVVFEQENVCRVFPPDHAHHYFRVIVSSIQYQNNYSLISG